MTECQQQIATVVLIVSFCGLIHPRIPFLALFVNAALYLLDPKISISPPCGW